MGQTEITVQVFEEFEKVVEKLEGMGFQWIDTFTGCDRYYTTLKEEELKDIGYKSLLDSSIVIRSFHKKKSDVSTTMLLHKKKTLDINGNVIGEEKSSVIVEDGEKTAKVLDSAGLINWMTLHQQNSFYKNGEKTVIVGTVKGLEGTFIEIEEYPSISGLEENEKFKILSDFIDSLGMKKGNDYSCKKIYMLYQKSQSESKRR